MILTQVTVVALTITVPVNSNVSTSSEGEQNCALTRMKNRHIVITLDT